MTTDFFRVADIVDSAIRQSVGMAFGGAGDATNVAASLVPLCAHDECVCGDVRKRFVAPFVAAAGAATTPATPANAAAATPTSHGASTEAELQAFAAVDTKRRPGADGATAMPIIMPKQVTPLQLLSANAVGEADTIIRRVARRIVTAVAKGAPPAMVPVGLLQDDGGLLGEVAGASKVWLEAARCVIRRGASDGSMTAISAVGGFRCDHEPWEQLLRRLVCSLCLGTALRRTADGYAAAVSDVALRGEGDVHSDVAICDGAAAISATDVVLDAPHLIHLMRCHPSIVCRLVAARLFFNFRVTVGTVTAIGIHGLSLPPRSLLVQAFSQPHCPPREALTVGARALAKHIHRDVSASWWGGSQQLRGSQAEKNAAAEQVLNRILSVLSDNSWGLDCAVSRMSTCATFLSDSSAQHLPCAAISPPSSSAIQNGAHITCVRSSTSSSHADTPQDEASHGDASGEGADRCGWMNFHMLPHNIVVFELRVTLGYGARWQMAAAGLARDRPEVTAAELLGANKEEEAAADGAATTATTIKPSTPAVASGHLFTFRGFLEPHDAEGHARGWQH